MWFNDIGNKLLSSMIIICILPPIEFISLWLLSYLLRAWDQNKLFCARQSPFKTKTKTILAYVSLYQGKEFDIEY